MTRHLALLLLVSALIAAAAVPAAAGEATPADLAAIDQIVIAQMKAAHIPGVSLGIVRGGAVVHTKGFGEASPGRPMLAGTPMVLGPASQAVTAATVMQLVEAGKLDLDAPVTQYLPWFHLAGPAGDAGAITIRHLLMQTSGLPVPPDAPTLAGDGNRTLEESVYSLREMAPAAPPGSAFRQSSLNYDLLGLVVQAVSGQAFGEYLRTHVFAPLQMRRSFTDEVAAVREFMAEGHQMWLGFSAPTAATYRKESVPSGYIISTAADMAQFLAARLGRGGEMGFLTEERGGVKLLTLRGETPGFACELVMIPEMQSGFIILANAQHPLTGAGLARMAEGITAVLSGRPAPVPSWWQRSAWFRYNLAYLAAWGLVVWSLESIRRWRQRLVSAGLRARWLALGAVALHLLAASGLAFGILPLTGGSWAHLQLFIPDLGRLAAAAVLANFIGAAIRVWVSITTLRKQGDTWKQSSDRATA